MARSRPGRTRHERSHARRAACTARSTSSGPASATSASFSSVAGLIVAKYRPDFGSTNSPPTNRPYRGLIATMSLASGAGAYCHCPAWAGRRSSRRSNFFANRSSSVDREIVGTLIGPGPLLDELHQHVVQQRGGADAEAVGRHPLGAERLVEEHEVLDGLLRLTDAAGHLHTDPAARLAFEVACRLHHAQR